MLTPGPWRIEYEPYCHVRSDAGCVLASDYTTPENANLISAAPDLLAALQALVEHGTDSPEHQAAEAAIAKALGA